MKNSIDPIEVRAMQNQRALIPLNLNQKKLIAAALRSKAATVRELSEWSGCDPFTVLAIAQKTVV